MCGEVSTLASFFSRAGLGGSWMYSESYFATFLITHTPSNSCQIYTISGFGSDASAHAPLPQFRMGGNRRGVGKPGVIGFDERSNLSQKNGVPVPGRKKLSRNIWGRTSIPGHVSPRMLLRHPLGVPRIHGKIIPRRLGEIFLGLMPRIPGEMCTIAVVFDSRRERGGRVQ